jgi:demethylmenaquinone methyltransferase / 2-methoxy-6-polyprenyl-1,4-benzoquinol methylase
MPKSTYTGRDKELYVARLFASAASRYDLINNLMSFGRHRAWRRFAVTCAGIGPGSKALDVAAGTADFTLDLTKVVGPNGLAVGIDFCLPMLRLGYDKLQAAGEEQPALSLANAEKLPFADDCFDCATIGFALRNVASVETVLAEMTRVVRPGGRVVSVEITGPDSPLVRPVWQIYFNRFVPLAVGLFGGNKEAYHYLPDSVERFYSSRKLTNIMENCGLAEVRVRRFALGAVSLHVGTKR